MRKHWIPGLQMTPGAADKQVATVIPCAHGKALLQLRDDKPEIDFPGHWGLFGGSINPAEDPAEAAKRELGEEVGYRPAEIYLLGLDQVVGLGGIAVYAYRCDMDVPIDRLDLQEGMDLGLFDLDEIKAGALYSTRMRGTYPVVPVPYVLDMIEKALVAAGIDPS